MSETAYDPDELAVLVDLLKQNAPRVVMCEQLGRTPIEIDAMIPVARVLRARKAAAARHTAWQDRDDDGPYGHHDRHVGAGMQAKRGGFPVMRLSR